MGMTPATGSIEPLRYLARGMGQGYAQLLAVQAVLVRTGELSGPEIAARMRRLRRLVEAERKESA